MTESKIITNAPKLNILRSEVFHGITVDMRNQFLNLIPWFVSISIKVSEAIKRLNEVPLNTLFVVDDESKLVGIITKNPELIEGFKKGGPPSTKKKCQQLCDSKCADRGGCAFICWNPWGGNAKCLYECNDLFDQAQTVGGTWF